MAMQLPEWAVRRPLTLSWLGCIVVGLLLGWLNTPLTHDTNAAADASPWQPPSTAALSRYSAGAFQNLRASKAWADVEATAGGGDVRDQAGQLVPRWSLVGVVLTPVPTALILDGTQGKVERLAVGANLPDGSTLAAIHHDSVTLSTRGCARQVRLFPSPHDTKAESCPPPDQVNGGQPRAGDHHD